jgi:spore germination protein GerM
MAESGSNKKKKPAPKKKAPAKKAPPRSSGSSRNWGPAYMLIIMVLLTVIVLLMYRLYRTTGPGGISLSFLTGKNVTERKHRFAAVSRHDAKERKEIRKHLDREGKKDDAGRENSAAAVEKSIRIYLLRVDENSGRTSLVPVTRKVTGEDLLNESLQTLIKGPTRYEENRGLLSAVPGGLKLHSVRTRGDMALLDFNSAIEYGATGSILISRIDQIVYTATQFPNIKSVVITINGTKKHFIGSDGLSINGPLHRRN